MSNPPTINRTPRLTFSLPHLPTPPPWYLAFHCCLTADGTRLMERRASDLWSLGSDCQPVRKYPGWPFIIAPVPPSVWPPRVFPLTRGSTELNCQTACCRITQLKKNKKRKETAFMRKSSQQFAYHIFSLSSPPTALFHSLFF